jgi:hypothetical protein
MVRDWSATLTRGRRSAVKKKGKRKGKNEQRKRRKGTEKASVAAQTQMPEP